ncbi:MAG: cbb3-type cytochrome c oxidase subunit I [Sandaracinaceae bacterium]|nr:cbb3-type cytochrome c oxidase subunit I [Sandaracinaceae bacterium]
MAEHAIAADEHAPEHAHAGGHGAHHEQSFFVKYLWSTDHKVIAMQYLFTGMAMALLGGFFAYAFRMQLAFPGASVPGFGVVTPDAYNSLVTNHGSIMIFWVAMPVLIAAFGNYLIPLMIGCDDMVFPRLNRLSYQIFLLSALILLASFFVPGGAFGGAWTAYPPLSAQSQYSLTPLGSTLWLVAVALEFVAFLLGGINFVTTVTNSRAPGMKMFDIPMVIWMIVIASIVFMASVGPLVAGAVMLLFRPAARDGLLRPDAGRRPDPLAASLLVLRPPRGLRGAPARHGHRGRRDDGVPLARSSSPTRPCSTAIATGILSFFVWAHHQFIAGIDPRMANVFTVTTVLISIPIAEMCFVYIATLYGGSIRLTTPMLWALGFLAEFLIGGVTGIFLGSSGSDIYFHDTYFVLAHFHYTFFPIAIIAVFAGVTYWYPKMFGRMLNETLGKIHFWGTTICFNGIFIPLFILGAAGQHRRIYSYEHFPELFRPELQNLRVVATVFLIALLAFQLVFLYNFFVSLKRGAKAGKNPWRANTLEWTTESPPPHGNFETMPTVSPRTLRVQPRGTATRTTGRRTRRPEERHP